MGRRRRPILGDRRTVVTVPAVAWWDVPDRVVWIDLPTRRLQGFDHYWVAWPRYGVWNDPENMIPDPDRGWHYEGIPAVGWESTGDGGEVELDDPTPPVDAQVWDGWMLSDDDARAVGLI